MSPFLITVHKTNPYTNRKQNIHKQKTPIVKELVPSVVPMLKEHIRLGHAGIIDRSI